MDCPDWKPSFSASFPDRRRSVARSMPRPTPVGGFANKSANCFPRISTQSFMLPPRVRRGGFLHSEATMGSAVSFGGADHRERLRFLADVFPVRSDVLDGVAYHQSDRATEQRILASNQCHGSDARRILHSSLVGLFSTTHALP